MKHTMYNNNSQAELNAQYLFFERNQATYMYCIYKTKNKKVSMWESKYFIQLNNTFYPQWLGIPAARLFKSKIRRSFSLLPVKSCVLSDEKLTLFTMCLWVKVWSSSPLKASHSFLKQIKINHGGINCPELIEEINKTYQFCRQRLLKGFTLQDFKNKTAILYHISMHFHQE